MKSIIRDFDIEMKKVASKEIPLAEWMGARPLPKGTIWRPLGRPPRPAAGGGPLQVKHPRKRLPALCHCWECFCPNEAAEGDPLLLCRPCREAGHRSHIRTEVASK